LPQSEDNLEQREGSAFVFLHAERADRTLSKELREQMYQTDRVICQEGELQQQVMNQAALLAQRGFTVPTLRPVDQNGAQMSPQQIRQHFGSSEHSVATESINTGSVTWAAAENDNHNSESMHHRTTLENTLSSTESFNFSPQVRKTPDRVSVGKTRQTPSENMQGTSILGGKVAPLDLSSLNGRPKLNSLKKVMSMRQPTTLGANKPRRGTTPLSLNLQKAVEGQNRLMGLYKPVSKANIAYDLASGSNLSEDSEESDVEDATSSDILETDGTLDQEGPRSPKNVPPLNLTLMPPDQDDSTEESSYQKGESTEGSSYQTASGEDDLANLYNYGHYNSGSRST